MSTVPYTSGFLFRLRYFYFRFSKFSEFSSSPLILKFSKWFTRLASFLGFGVGNDVVWSVVFVSLLPGAADDFAVGIGVVVLVAVGLGVVHDDALVGVGVVGLDSSLFLRYFLLGVRFASWGIIVSFGFLALALAILLEGWVSVVSGANFCFIFDFDLFEDFLNSIS